MKEIKISNDDKALYELMLKEKTEPSENEKYPVQIQGIITKDKVLDNFYDRVGLSRYQILQIFVISLLNISIGAESVFLNVIELQLISEMHLEMYQAAMLVSCFSFGIAIGNFLIFFYIIK